MTTNTIARLKSRPTGLVNRENFDIREEPVGTPGEGEFLVRVEMISIDPAMRGWMNEGRSYVPPVGIGEVMRALAGGTVLESNHPGYSTGDAVTGLLGVQEYAISDGEGVMRVDTAMASLADWLGGLGMPGITAYFGLTEIGRPKEGETVLVSAASGAVGSIVGQIAKLKGCRAVGIAGGPEKCRYVVEELGFDSCVDYKNDVLADALKAHCPDGVDVYFENVGGAIFDTVLTRMNTFGRIPVCGMISAYNATEAPPGPKNLRSILVNRLTVRGFIVFDFIDRYPEAIHALAGWHGQGRIKFRQDVREGGIQAYPDVLNLLFSGGNQGKLVLKT
jgi:NADPH-dependent curcumin reductase CurA